MPSAVICTVALGAKYTATAAPLLEFLTRAGNRCLVLTDDPAIFASDIETIPAPDDTHPWQQKRNVIRHALAAGAETAYFLDSDHRTLVSNHTPRVQALPPGLHTGYAVNLREHQSAFRAETRMPIYEAACAQLGIDESAMRAQLRFIWDSVFAISKDPEGRWLRLLDCWDKYALWLRDTNQITTDGVAMGLCAHVADFPIHAPATALHELTCVCQHLCHGEWRQNLDGPEIP
jgi:hypothetical protein